MIQYPLTSGTGIRTGAAWTNRASATGTPALLTAAAQFSSVTLSGTPFEGTAAVAEVRVLAYAGTPQESEIALLGLAGAVYAYTVGAAESLQDVLDGLVTAATADPNWTVVRAGDTLECTASATGPQPDNAVAAAYLSTFAFFQLAGTTATGDICTLTVEADEYSHTSVTGNTKSHIAQALVAEAASNLYWSIMWGGDGLVIAQCLYPTESVDEVSMTIVQAKDVYGNPVGNLTYTKTVQTGDVVSVMTIPTPGADAAPATVYGAVIAGTDYHYSATVGDTLNDCAVALATLIGADYTVDAPPAADTIVFHGVGPFTVVDSSANGAACTPALVSEGNAANPVYPSTENFWLCQQQNSCSIVANLVSGTSYKVTPHLYNNATGTWTAGTTSGAITANTVISVDTTNGDGMFVELSDFAGSGVASIVVQSITATP